MVIGSQNNGKGDACMFWGQTRKIVPQILWKLGIFPVLALFSTCSSLKSGLPGPLKIIIFDSAK